MEIITRDFGPVQVEDDAIFEFPQGLYGFESSTRFAVFEQKFDDISFLYMQSLLDTYPCFLIFEPWDLYPDYAPVLSAEDMKLCEISDVEELIFICIANIPDNNVRELSINVKSPVVLNPKTRKGRQIILQNPDYMVRYQPFL